MDIKLDLDPTSSTYGDILFTPDGDLQTVDGAEEILQNILQSLRTYLGEWYLDTTLGVDYFGQILVKNPNIGDINAILINQILNVPGVQALTAYSFTPDFLTRQMGVKFSAQTTSGIVNYAGLITQ